MRTLLLMLLLPFTSICLAGTEVLQFKTGVEIDGKNKEWTSPLPQYNKKTGINYSVTNDLDNLYFVLRIADTSIIKQVLKNGLEIWINKDGKKKKTTGVTFPLPVETVAGQSGTNNATQEGSKQGINTEISFKGALPGKELKLTGFLIDNGKQPVIGCRVKVAASIDDAGCLIYELAVPFNTFYKERLDQEDKATKFYIGFIIKDVEISSNEGMPAGMMGGYGGMMRGHDEIYHMGGMGYPGGMGGMNQVTGTPEKVFWFKAIPNLQ